MVDASGAPRRVSMAYILGFSNRPFKDGGPPAPPPPPRHANAFKQMVTTPGGVLEWTASDGRRGRLTGQGKPRLTTTSLAHRVDSEAVQKDTGSVDGDMCMMGLFGNDAPAASASAKAADDNHPASNDWSREQDEKLMELKSESAPWANIAAQLDKKDFECKERFKQIKPKDWKPSNAKGGGGGKQKQGKQKSQKGQKGQQDSEDKDRENTDADGFKNATNTEWDASIGGVAWGTNTDNKDAFGFNDTTPGWGDGSGGNDATGWDTINNSGNNSGENVASAWDTNHNGNVNAVGNGGNSGWDTVPSGDTYGAPADEAFQADASKKTSPNRVTSNTDLKGDSNKVPANSCSKHHSSRGSEKPSASAPKEYELEPDSTFSADELRLIAKILQQDCSMVWNRVSWRFKDKTGRNLHPDLFEKKITGVVEDKGSDRGRG